MLGVEHYPFALSRARHVFASKIGAGAGAVVVCLLLLLFVVVVTVVGGGEGTSWPSWGTPGPLCTGA